MDEKKITTWVARKTLDAFYLFRQHLREDCLTEGEREAVDSLPKGDCERRSEIDGSFVRNEHTTGRTRLSGFPDTCCVEATQTLGILYTMAGVAPETILEMTATSQKPSPQYNFHKWIFAGGLSIDITIGQFYPDKELPQNAIAFFKHPIESDSEYVVEKKVFVPDGRFVKFAESIGFEYIFPPGSKERDLPIIGPT